MAAIEELDASRSVRGVEYSVLGVRTDRVLTVFFFTNITILIIPFPIIITFYD